jgi:hypothetical protein
MSGRAKKKGNFPFEAPIAALSKCTVFPVALNGSMFLCSLMKTAGAGSNIRMFRVPGGSDQMMSTCGMACPSRSQN